MSEENQNQGQQSVTPPTVTRNDPAAQPHRTQAPQTAPVAFNDLQAHVTGERSVHRGARALVQGIRQRLEEIAGNDSKDAATVKQDLQAFVGELNADTWANALVQNTSAKNDPDPNSNAPVAPQINR